MDIRTLRYFLAVVREGNISRAAELINTTQPNLSRQMKDLEDEIGKSLFERGARRITLTPTGKLLRKRAEEILELCRKTEMELIGDEERIGEINIGGGESKGMTLISRALRLMRKDYEDTKINLYSGDYWDVSDRLDKGLLDFALMIEPSDISRYESIRLPLSDLWGVLIPSDDPFSKKESITKSDLKGKRVMVSRHAMQPGPISVWLDEIVDELLLVSTYNLIYNASLLALDRHGWLVGLEGLVPSSDEGLIFVPFEPRLESRLDIVWKKNAMLSGGAKVFLEYLRKVTQETG